MSTECAKVHLSITDGTYIDLLHSSNQYTPERHDTYRRWKKLHKQYKEVEFNVLIRNQQTTGPKKKTNDVESI